MEEYQKYIKQKITYAKCELVNNKNLKYCVYFKYDCCYNPNCKRIHKKTEIDEELTDFSRTTSTDFSRTTSTDFSRTTSTDFSRTTSTDFSRTTTDFSRTTSLSLSRTASLSLSRTSSIDISRTTSIDTSLDISRTPSSVDFSRITSDLVYKNTNIIESFKMELLKIKNMHNHEEYINNVNDIENKCKQLTNQLNNKTVFNYRDSLCKFIEPNSISKLPNSISKLPNSISKLPNSISKLPNSISKLPQSNRKFNGLDLHYRLNLCNKVGCSCNKAHNMYNQTKNITNVMFNEYIANNKLPLKELLIKLNDVYYKQVDKIMNIVKNRSTYFKHEYFITPNGRNNIIELSKIFNLIENCNDIQIKSIYYNYLSQLDYSLIYEIFRRSKRCSNNVYKKNCYYGINCKKGHHGVDAICYDDLFVGTCNCNPKASNKIDELKEKIVYLQTSNDGFITISKEKTCEIKKLTNDINKLKDQQIMHLNRDNLITNEISSIIQNINENNFNENLPCVQTNYHFEITHHENMKVVKLEKQKKLEQEYLNNLSKICSKEEYNTLCTGKKLNHINSRWEKIPEFLPNTNGDFGFPNQFIIEAHTLSDRELLLDFSKEHK